MIKSALAREIANLIERELGHQGFSQALPSYLAKVKALPTQSELVPEVELSKPKPELGDFATNYALINAKKLGENPIVLANRIASLIETLNYVGSVSVAGPGFINIKLKASHFFGCIGAILGSNQEYGFAKERLGKKLNVEFVSVNPNGPITVGSGRGAAYGDTLCRVLRAAGYDVDAEFYVNDALNSEQMRLFSESVRFYLAELEGLPIPFIEGGYRGDYVKDVAIKIHHEKLATSDSSIQELQTISQNLMLASQKADLAEFGVHFQRWFSEQSMHDSGFVQETIDKVRYSNVVDDEPYRTETIHEGKITREERMPQEAGPVWLRSNALGDDKDRVLIRADGRPAYIAGDLAYMENKLGVRGYEKAITILGPDHHGYIGRLKAVAKALGHGSDQFEVIIYQIVRFVRDGKLAPMRKRDGNIYTLRDLITETGVDAARFFYLMRSHETHIDFDINLATSQSDDNPVYYCQYAHARICSIISKASELNITVPKWSEDFAGLLGEPSEIQLIRKVADLDEEILRCADDYAVNRLATYSIELARFFHNFYQSCRVIAYADGSNQNELDRPLTLARLCLCEATRIALMQSLNLLGVSAPERMTRSS